MKSVGVMQPYFFPYIGYFQLIDAVDVYVNLDHVSFMKRSYMTRNKLKNDTPFSIPVINGSQNKSCIDVKIGFDRKYLDKLTKTIHYNYHKEKNYEEVVSTIFGSSIGELANYEYDLQPFLHTTTSISEFNMHYIQKVCDYLDINTKLIYTSKGLTDKKKGEGLKEITKKLGGGVYVNAIGGTKLYDKEDFSADGIDLQFVQMGDVCFPNKYSSILHLLFTHDKDYIKEQLKKYTLI